MSSRQRDGLSGTPTTVDVSTSLALFVVLAGYPALRAAEFQFYFTDTGADWWLFMGLSSLGHWVCFAFVAWALRRNGETWQSIGLDWSWLARYRIPLLGGLVLLVLAACSVELLGPESPPRQGLFPLFPKSIPERLFMIFFAVATAPVVEETLYRGFAITRLNRVLPSVWLALPISTASFFFIHGTPSDPGRIASLLLAGTCFGAVFIVLRCRRLEWLMVVHALVNAGVVLIP